jgi:integrase
MARHPEGFTLEPDPRTGIVRVRFRHERRRRKITTGERDPGRAAEKARQIYAEVVSGRWRPGLANAVRPGTPLDEPAADWLADIEADHDDQTIQQYKMYVSTHWQPFFGSLDRITTVGGDDYWRFRLRSVKRKTVQKELSALRGFLSWCAERGYVAETPLVRSPPARATGQADTKRAHKDRPTELSPADIQRIIAFLPELSEGRFGKRRFPVKARFIVAWETGLRPSTLDQIEAPTDYHRGATELVIRDEIDKARFGRTVPLSDAARAALDSVTPEVGAIFGRHHGREYLAAAAKKAGIENVSPYDFRHARLTDLVARTGDLTGIAYLAGHKNITTTNRYVHPNKRAAERVLLQATGTTGAEYGPHTGPTDERDRRGRSAKSLVRKEGIEPSRE